MIVPANQSEGVSERLGSLISRGSPYVAMCTPVGTVDKRGRDKLLHNISMIASGVCEYFTSGCSLQH